MPRQTKKIMIAVLALTIGLTLGSSLTSAAQSGRAFKALVYNATGLNLKVVVNARSDLLTPESPFRVFSGVGRLIFETANNDGTLLTRSLEDGEVYVVLYRRSTGNLAIWSMNQLSSQMADVLASRLSDCSAVVFNATGKLVEGASPAGKSKLDRAACLFLPEANSPNQLKVKFLSPEIPAYGPLKPGSQHVLVYNRDDGHELMSLEDWYKDLAEEIGPGAKPPVIKSVPIISTTEPIVEENLPDR